MADKPSKELSSTVPSFTPLGEYAGKPPLTLKKEVVVVGADEHSHMHLVSSSVSKYHALIIKGEGGVYIHDLASRTKVKVNGKEVRGAVLKNGDKVQIGRFVFQFNAPPPNGDGRAAAPAAIAVDGQLRPGAVEGRALLIGRAEGCAVKLAEPDVSTRHAVIFEANGRRFIRDLNSRTGTYVNGQKTHQTPLKFGDKVRVGHTDIVLTTLKKAAELQQPAAAALDPLPLAQPEMAPKSFAVDDSLPVEEPSVETPALGQPSVEELAPKARTAQEPSAQEPIGEQLVPLADASAAEPFDAFDPIGIEVNEGLSTLSAPADLIPDVTTSVPAAPEPSRQAARDALAKAAKTAETPAKLRRETPIGLEPISDELLPEAPVKRQAPPIVPAPPASPAAPRRETPIGLEPIPDELLAKTPSAGQASPSVPAPRPVPAAPRRETPIGLEPIPDELLPAATNSAAAMPAPPLPSLARVRPAVPPPLGTRPPEPAFTAPPEEDLVDLGLDFVEETPAALPVVPLATSARRERPEEQFVPEPRVVQEFAPLPLVDSGLQLPSHELESAEEISASAGPDVQSLGHSVDAVIGETAIPAEMPPVAQSKSASTPPAAPTPPIPRAAAAPILVQLAEPKLPELKTIQLQAPSNFDWATNNATLESAQEELANEAIPTTEEPVAALWTAPIEDLSEVVDDIEIPTASPPPPAEFDLPPATPAMESPVFDLGVHFGAEGSSTTFLPDLDASFATTHSAGANPPLEAAEEAAGLPAQPAAEMERAPAIPEPASEPPTPAGSTEAEAIPMEPEISPAPTGLAADVAPLLGFETSEAEATPLAMEPDLGVQPEPTADPQPLQMEDPFAPSAPASEAVEPEPPAAPQSIQLESHFAPGQDLVPLEPEGIATINSAAAAPPDLAQAVPQAEKPEAGEDPTLSSTTSAASPSEASSAGAPTDAQPSADGVPLEVPAKRRRGRPKKAETPVKPPRSKSKRENAPTETAATIPADAMPVEPSVDLAPPLESTDEIVPLAPVEAPLDQQPIADSSSATLETPVEISSPVPGAEAPIEIDQIALTGHSVNAKTSRPAFEPTIPQSQTSAAPAETGEFAIDLTMPDLPQVKGTPENVEADAGIFKSAPVPPIKGLAALQVRDEDFDHLKDTSATPVEFPAPAPVSPEPPAAANVQPDELSVESMPESLEPFSESKVDLDAFLNELETQVEPPHPSAPRAALAEGRDGGDRETPLPASRASARSAPELSPPAPTEASPSDTAFGREIESFTTDSTGPLVEEFEPNQPAAPDLNIPILEPPDLELPSLETISAVDAAPIEPGAFEALESAAPISPSFEESSGAESSPPEFQDTEAAVAPLEEFPMSSTGADHPAPAIDTEGLSTAAFNIDSAGFAFDVESSVDHVPAPEQRLASADASSAVPQSQPAQIVPGLHTGSSPEIAAPPAGFSASESFTYGSSAAPSPESPATGNFNPPGGLSHIGGGIVNLDHFLGGMPVKLPNITPPPSQFGRIAIDLDARSAPISPFHRPAPVVPSVKPPDGRAPAAAPQSRATVAPAAPRPKAAPPAPAIQPAPATPRAKPTTPPAPPAKPKTPPRPRNLRQGPFANVPFGSKEGARGGAADSFGGITTAFEGLSAVRQTDVFSNLEANLDALGNAVYAGGAKANHQASQGAPVPDLARDPDKDFADDDFWNRTDEEDGLPPMGAAKPATPQPAPSREAQTAHAPVETVPEETAPEKIATDIAPEEFAAEEIAPHETAATEIASTEIARGEPPQEPPTLQSDQRGDPSPDANQGHYDLPADDLALEALNDQVPAQEEAAPEEAAHEEIPQPDGYTDAIAEEAPQPGTSYEEVTAEYEVPTEPPLAKDPFGAAVSRDEAAALEPAQGAVDVPIAAYAGESEIARINPPSGGGAVAMPPRRRRKDKIRTRMLMLAMLASMGAVLGGIWALVPVRSNISGTVTFLSYDYTPESNDGIQFESNQRKLFADPQMRMRAIDILKVQHPGSGDGFLDVPDFYTRVANSFSLSSNHAGDRPETTVTLAYDSNRASQDKIAMAALIQAFIVADSGTVDDNRRLRADADSAAQTLADTKQKLDQVNRQISDLEANVNNQPSIDTLTALTQKKAQLEAQRRAAEDAADADRQEIVRLQSAGGSAPDQPGTGAANAMVASAGQSGSSGPDAGSQPVDADPQLKQMQQHLADLNANLAAARSDEAAGATLARQQLEGAVKDFSDQLSNADEVLGSSTDLKQFVDSAKDSQFKARSLITMLIVDGEDLEKQLEDTRRDVEDLIQSRQRQKWASDPQLQQLQASLDSAQHKYNAAVGQGIQDPQTLDPLQHEIDDWSSQIKARQAQLGVDPSEVKVEDGLNKVIQENRNKLDKEKGQIDQVLDPLEKQLNDLDPVVAALPDAQQELARHIRERLNALNDSRKHYAAAVGEGGTAPSAKVTSLQQQLSELQTQFDRRQSDLAQQLHKRLDAQRVQELASAQQKLDEDQKNLDALRKEYFDAQLKLEDVSARRDAAKGDQMRLLTLGDEKTEATRAVDDAQRDFDQKQAASASAYDIKPFSEADVIAAQSGDPRWNYSAFAVIGLAVLFAMATMLSNRAYEPPPPLVGRQDDSGAENPRNRPKDPTSTDGFPATDNGEEAKWA